MIRNLPATELFYVVLRSTAAAHFRRMISYRWLQANLSTIEITFRLHYSPDEESLSIQRRNLEGHYYLIYTASVFAPYLQAFPRMLNVREVWFNYIKFRLAVELTLQVLVAQSPM